MVPEPPQFTISPTRPIKQMASENHCLSLYICLDTCHFQIQCQDYQINLFIFIVWSIQDWTTLSLPSSDDGIDDIRHAEVTITCPDKTTCRKSRKLFEKDQDEMIFSKHQARLQKIEKILEFLKGKVIYYYDTH